MSAKPRQISESERTENFGSLRGCFVEGDPEQQAREKRLRRRALFFSVLVQAAIVAAIVIVPLFFKTERIAYASIPIPPVYTPWGTSHHHVDNGNPRRPQDPLPCTTCPIFILRPPVQNNTGGSSSSSTAVPSDGLGPIGDPQGDPICLGCIPVASNQHPQIPHEQPPQETKTLRVTHLDPAMLIHRVEPTYPTLPKQMRREGKVELHAIISTDGTIQSLQAVGGDPMFFQSALDAVRQWLYKPTSLNGQPVQIDTNITIYYTLHQ